MLSFQYKKFTNLETMITSFITRRLHITHAHKIKLTAKWWTWASNRVVDGRGVGRHSKVISGCRFCCMKTHPIVTPDGTTRVHEVLPRFTSKSHVRAGASNGLREVLVGSDMITA